MRRLGSRDGRRDARRCVLVQVRPQDQVQLCGGLPGGSHLLRVGERVPSVLRMRAMRLLRNGELQLHRLPQRHEGRLYRRTRPVDKEPVLSAGPESGDHEQVHQARCGVPQGHHLHHRLRLRPEGVLRMPKVTRRRRRQFHERWRRRRRRRRQFHEHRQQFIPKQQLIPKQ